MREIIHIANEIDLTNTAIKNEAKGREKGIEEGKEEQKKKLETLNHLAIEAGHPEWVSTYVSLGQDMDPDEFIEKMREEEHFIA